MRDPERITIELNRRESRGPDLQLASDLEAANHHLEQINRKIQRYVRRFGDADEDILPLIERELAQVRREKEQTESVINDIKLRLAARQQSITDLRSLYDYCVTVEARLDQFTFDQKRVLFHTVNARVIANGRHWHFERTLPPVGVSTQSCLPS